MQVLHTNSYQRAFYIFTNLRHNTFSTLYVQPRPCPSWKRTLQRSTIDRPVTACAADNFAWFERGASRVMGSTGLLVTVAEAQPPQFDHKQLPLFCTKVCKRLMHGVSTTFTSWWCCQEQSPTPEGLLLHICTAVGRGPQGRLVSAPADTC